MSIPFVLNMGDSFYEQGIQEASDAQVNASYSSVFTTPYPSLQVPWLSVLGNHDYYGSVQALLDMHEAPETPHWYMPDRYYKFSHEYVVSEMGRWNIVAPLLSFERNACLSAPPARFKAAEMTPMTTALAPYRVEGSELSVDMFFLDTQAMVQPYLDYPAGRMPDLPAANYKKQLAWLEGELAQSTVRQRQTTRPSAAGDVS